MTRVYPEQQSREKYLLFVLFINLRTPDTGLLIMHLNLSIIQKNKSDFQLFYEDEMKHLFAACEGTDNKSLRDRALLEMLYATGIRVSELTSIQLSDIDTHLGIVLVMGKGTKERYIPFGSFAEDAINAYIETSRPKLMKKKGHNTLFVNLRGDPLTDRGVRYILTSLMERASLHSKIYPHMIRHTFATHLLSNGADMRSERIIGAFSSFFNSSIYTYNEGTFTEDVYEYASESIGRMVFMEFHATTIFAIRHDGACAMSGDGQVTVGNAVVMKHTAKKVREFLAARFWRVLRVQLQMRSLYSIYSKGNLPSTMAIFNVPL